MNSHRVSSLPVVVIGAGPVGLASAAHLLEHGLEPLVLEAGAAAGAAVAQWSHVRMFSPWRELIDVNALALLRRHGHSLPVDGGFPTGAEFVEEYLAPLAALPEVAARLRLDHRVTSVTRIAPARGGAFGRDAAPFVVLATGGAGTTRILARAVIDASGTWGQPNHLGPDAPVAGEIELRHRLHYGIPDILGVDRPRYAGNRTLVVGGGHSAMNALWMLVTLASEEPGTEVLWAVRGQSPRETVDGLVEESTSRSKAFEVAALDALQTGRVEMSSEFTVAALARQDDGIRVGSADGRKLYAHQVIVATGYRPDLHMLRGLRLDLDPATEAPRGLAPLIAGSHSCLSVRSHGVTELSHPEYRFFLAGMKSYGRSPNFLLRTGYQQVRSITAFLAGEHGTAKDSQSGPARAPTGQRLDQCCIAAEAAPNSLDASQSGRSTTARDVAAPRDRRIEQ